MKIKNKDYKLAFTMRQWAELEEAGIMIDDIKDIHKGKDRVRKIVTLLSVMADDPEVTVDFLFENMKMSDLQKFYFEAINVISAAEKMETDDPDRERDLVLEEIQKKSNPTV